MTVLMLCAFFQQDREQPGAPRSGQWVEVGVLFYCFTPHTLQCAHIPPQALAELQGLLGQVWGGLQGRQPPDHGGGTSVRVLPPESRHLSFGIICEGPRKK